MAYRYPESNVFYRKLGRPYPRIVRGDGCWLYDEQGKPYLDACGGAFVANLGHSNRDIAEALATQARRFGYVSATAFTHEPVEALAAELADTLPGDLDKLYFLSSGSEAVEAALKLARQYWVERGLPKKHKIIALAPAYHGNTLLALSASARPIPTAVPAAVVTPGARFAAAPRWRRRFGGSVPTRWPRSSPSRSEGLRPAPPRRGRSTSRGFAKSATATRCSSSPTSSCAAPAAPARGGR